MCSVPLAGAGPNDLEIVAVMYPDPVEVGDSVKFRVDVRKNVYDPMDFESILNIIDGTSVIQSMQVHMGYGEYIASHFHNWIPVENNVGICHVIVTIKWWQGGILYSDVWSDFIEVKPKNNASAVGGVWVPVDKLGLLAPYIGLASTIVVATAATAIHVKRVKRRKER